MTHKILLAAALLGQGACSLAMAAPMDSVAHNVRATNLTAKSQQDDVQNVQGLHLMIRGGTAQWAFLFTCVDAHCEFRHMRAAHHGHEPEHIDLSVRMTCSAGCTSHQNSLLQSASVSQENIRDH
jgi:hypothetical protein